MKLENVKLTCPKCGKEMELLEVRWTGEFLFICRKCNIYANFRFYDAVKQEPIYREGLKV